MDSTIVQRLDALKRALAELRQTQLEHGQTLAAHGQALEQIAAVVASLSEGQA